MLKVDELKNLRSTIQHRQTQVSRGRPVRGWFVTAVSLRGKVYKMKMVALRKSQECRAAGGGDEDVHGISD